MRTIGGLLLLVALGLLVFVGINASGDMLSEANQSNDTTIQSASSGSGTTIQTLMTAFGFLALIVGAMLAIGAFR